MKILKYFIIVFAVAIHSWGNNKITLAERNKSSAYSLVISQKASESQKYAATELQHFIKQQTGVKLPIITDQESLPSAAVLLGNTVYTKEKAGCEIDFATLGDDGFRIIARPPYLIIAGSEVRGTLYGVYEVLERFGGCRWFTSWHSVVPELTKFVVPIIDETQKPAFVLREPYWYDMFEGDFAARSKVNGNRMKLTAKHGGKVKFARHLFCHTFETLCPSDEFFDAHPEYFSEINGKRLKSRTQLCLTNPDVVKVVTERLLEHIRKEPDAKLFSVSQNDWRNNCTCTKCKALDEREGTHAGTIIAFVNQVAEAVEREFPDVWIETLAYRYTRKPPATVRPRHNVVPRLCTIECDFSHPLNLSKFKENRNFLEDMRGWSAISKRLYVWDYVTNFRNYIAPFPNLMVMQPNLQFFRDSGVVGIFEQGAYQGRHGEFAELKAWLLAKLMWNPDSNFEHLLSDFLTGYYGKGAPYIKEYINLIHSVYTDSENNPLLIYELMRESKIPDSKVDYILELWQSAIAATEGSEYSYNVRMSAIPAFFLWITQNSQRKGIKVWVTEHPDRFIPSEKLQPLVKQLLTYYNEAKNIRTSESSSRDALIVESWHNLSEKSAAEPTTLAIVEDKKLSVGDSNRFAERIKDPLAEDGSAIKHFNTHYEWTSTLDFDHVAFDDGYNYKLRVRVRIEMEEGSEGEAFWSGIYDYRNKRSCGEISVKCSEIGQGYQWYDVVEWKPETHNLFWFGPGRFKKTGDISVSSIKAVYLDKIELRRIDKK